ncbi:hypothetical protein INR49_030099 [Caranx melampygus]|nr:hypothetical protein INR49_030099 [Caranx melampygus]
MTSISAFIIKTLCDHQGSLDFQRLNHIVALRFPSSESLLSRFLFDDDRLAVKVGRKKATFGQAVSPDSLVVAKTSLRICQKRNGDCLHCEDLHLCRYYVCGDCTFGYKCKNPHSLASPYNAELLKKHGLQDLTEKQLFQLLLQNDPYLLPEICPHYNKGNGLHGSCMFGTDCTKLHVCQHYFQGDCKFGTSCKRAHNIHAQGVKVFRGFSPENIQNLHGIYRNKLIIMNLRTVPTPVLPKMANPTQLPSHSAFQQHSHQSSQQPSHTSPGRPPTRSACPSKPSSDADKNEICLYFIRRHCRFTEKCVHVHWTLPYRWQVLDRDGKTWKDLTNIEDIEKAFCDPGHDTDQPISEMFRLFGLQSSASSIAQSVNFMTMSYEGSPVRRLSTASSVSKPPHFILTTQWLWYWKDENGRWLEFGQGDSDTPASVTSETLENVYLADRDAEIPFSAGKHQYILHFKGKPGTPQMYQENLKYKTKREVRRRPRFVSAHDVKAKVESASSPSSSISAAESFPSHWDKSALPDFGYNVSTFINSSIH